MSTMEVSLHTNNPLEHGFVETEINYPGYARQVVEDGLYTDIRFPRNAGAAVVLTHVVFHWPDTAPPVVAEVPSIVCARGVVPIVAGWCVPTTHEAE